MNRIISWVAFLWLLTVEALEQVFETARWHLLERSNASTRSENHQGNDSLQVVPPSATH